jgi:hypothetical protein
MACLIQIEVRFLIFGGFNKNVLSVKVDTSFGNFIF